ASNVSYEFELRELWDTQIAPEAAFLTSPNYYTETTATTTLLYHIGKPTLLPNKRYGWRVRAVSRTGLSKNSVFKNDGYSEIYYFTYNTACYPPRYVLSEAVGKAGVQIRWQGMPEHKRYHVQYKRADIPDAEWFEVYTYNTQVQISNLRAGKTYVFRVGGSCNELNDLNPLYAYSAINEFSLPAKNEKSSSYTCGIVPEIEISNTQPLQNIGINETFTAGDFPVTIKQVSVSNGRFRGVGYIVVPYLADTKLAVSFTNIRINTDYQLIEGVVSTTYDATWGDVESVDEEVEDMEDLIDDIFGEDTTEESNVDTDVINDTTTGENTNTNTNDTDNSNTDTSNNSSSDSSTTNTTDTTNSNSGTNTTTDTNAIENGSTDTNNTTSSTTEKEVVIEHNGKSYKNKDIIEVPYSREETNFAFLLKNYPKGAKINWQVLKLGTDNTSIFATNETIHDNFGINMKEIHILDVVANYNDEKIRVTIKRIAKEFKLEELYALHNKKRLAKSGQILYLVRTPFFANTNKKVKYALKLDKRLDENLIPPNAMQWSFNGENQYFSKAKTNITRDLEGSGGVITTSVNVGNPNFLEKSVDVKWVDGYNRKVSVISPAVQNALKELSGYVKKLGSVLKKLDNTGELEFNISFQGEENLEEDINSRFYNIIRKGGFGGNIDLVFNGFSYGLDLRVITAEVSLKPILSISSSGQMGYIKRNDKDSFTETGVEMGFGLNADLQVVGELGLSIKIVELKGKPYAGISSWGEIKYNNNTKRISGNVGIGKPYVGILGELLVGGYNVVPSGDIRHTWEEIKLEEQINIRIK
ncbi:fibronectin type III domain-containing protein, partial [Tenacibaculum maritimum]|uniref:fibronectin type III domain-containing protein n=4 Tax=Tenacibaculum maritimum TaxID=107401 RepID=UPI003876A016